MAAQELNSGKSVIVDNTNPEASTRSEYISVAKSLGTSPARFQL